MAESVNDENEETVNYRYGIRPYQFEPVRNNDSFNNVHNGSDETASSSSEGEDDRLTNTSWCSCNNCILMPTLTESICCREIRPVFRKMVNMEK